MALRRTPALLLLLLLALCLWGSPSREYASAQVSDTLPTHLAATPRIDLEAVALELINRDRAGAGLRPVSFHSRIQLAARRQAWDLLRAGRLSHRSIDGQAAAERLRRLGVRAGVVGENVGFATDVWAAHAAFLSSRPHRIHILSAGYTYAGIGVLVIGGAGVLVVQNFAGP